jgi:iron-sulfur cluster insertion protein
MIIVTPAAEEKILDILYDEKPGTCIRSYVQGGGCSGFQYGFMLDTNQSDDDFVVSVGPFKILVDAVSMQYIEGSTLDYKDDLMSCHFVINNPNAVGTCGCGSSFRVD